MENINPEINFTPLSQSKSNEIRNKLYYPLVNYYGTRYESLIHNGLSIPFLSAKDAISVYASELYVGSNKKVLLDSKFYINSDWLSISNVYFVQKIAHEFIHGFRTSLHETQELKPSGDLQTYYYLYQGLCRQKIIDFQNKEFQLIEKIGIGAEESKAELDSIFIAERIFNTRIAQRSDNLYYELLNKFYNFLPNLLNDPVIKRIIAKAELHPRQSDLWDEGRLLLIAFDNAYSSIYNALLEYRKRNLLKVKQLIEEYQQNLFILEKECEVFINEENNRFRK